MAVLHAYSRHRISVAGLAGCNTVHDPGHSREGQHLTKPLLLDNTLLHSSGPVLQPHELLLLSLYTSLLLPLQMLLHSKVMAAVCLHL